jgi:hypothetical protein
MFMCCVNQWSVINLDLTWKQSFLIINQIKFLFLPFFRVLLHWMSRRRLKSIITAKVERIDVKVSNSRGSEKVSGEPRLEIGGRPARSHSCGSGQRPQPNRTIEEFRMNISFSMDRNPGKCAGRPKILWNIPLPVSEKNLFLLLFKKKVGFGPEILLWTIEIKLVFTLKGFYHKMAPRTTLRQL